MYGSTILIGTLSWSYAAVAMHKAHCQESGFRVTSNTDLFKLTPDGMVAVQDRRIVPGESALAFDTATNISDRDIVGTAAYKKTPDIAAPNVRHSSVVLLRRTETECWRDGRYDSLLLY